ncbi:MAG: TIGR00730 family Rossman fold protein [Paludibacteraceae bacterium]|nr:TIGR00730 family Rossman fold protein [Paludibacteraceae bacterium]
MNIAVYCSSSDKIAECYRQVACGLGRLIGEKGHTLIYGGNACGLMGDVSSACAQAGGRVIGVNLEKWKDSDLPNSDNSETLYFKNLSERKNFMASKADLFVVLPGGLGTLDEAADIMARHQIGELKAQVWFLNTMGYYDALKVLFDHFLAEHCMTMESQRAFCFINTIDDLPI